MDFRCFSAQGIGFSGQEEWLSDIVYCMNHSEMILQHETPRWGTYWHSGSLYRPSIEWAMSHRCNFHRIMRGVTSWAPVISVFKGGFSSSAFPRGEGAVRWFHFFLYRLMSFAQCDGMTCIENMTRALVTLTHPHTSKVARNWFEAQFEKRSKSPLASSVETTQWVQLWWEKCLFSWLYVSA